MAENLFNKVWGLHEVRKLPNGESQLFIGLHLIHEVTSPQAFQMIREQGLARMKPKVRKIEGSGALGKGVYSKDVILKIIQQLGVNGGLGYAYEYSGETFSNMTMEERMSVCNMSIE